jgi:hypothetical protein
LSRLLKKGILQVLKNRGQLIGFAGLLPVLVAGSGCATMPAPSGFLSDYSRLEKTGQAKMGYLSSDLKNYDSFLVDPVQIRVERDPPVLKPEERAEVANYFRDAVMRVLRENDYSIVTDVGPQTARIRYALTDVQKSKWYLNLHFAMKFSGAFTGGASLEGEVIDSVTGQQLAAVIQAGRGNQFELDTFNALDDVKDVIDRWAKEASKRLEELKRGTVE